MKASAITQFHPAGLQERSEHLRKKRDSLPAYKRNAVAYGISFHAKTQFYNMETKAKINSK